MFGAAVIELIPRMIVGGMLVFLGLSFIVEWVWDRRRSLPRVEYVVVLVILAVVVAKGYLPESSSGWCSRWDCSPSATAGRPGARGHVRQTYRSNVDRPPAERDASAPSEDSVQILRVSGHVFFGSTNRLLERIRARAEGDPPGSS